MSSTFPHCAGTNSQPFLSCPVHAGGRLDLGWRSWESHGPKFLIDVQKPLLHFSQACRVVLNFDAASECSRFVDCFLIAFICSEFVRCFFFFFFKPCFKPPAGVSSFKLIVVQLWRLLRIPSKWLRRAKPNTEPKVEKI